MSTFDPSRDCAVHDGLNGCWLTWKPARNADHFRQHAAAWDTPGVVAWDGLLLDGWLDAMPAPAIA